MGGWTVTLHPKKGQRHTIRITFLQQNKTKNDEWMVPPESEGDQRTEGLFLEPSEGA